MEDKFNEAQWQVLNLAKRPSNQDLLELYGLYKQATKGDVEGERPGMLDVTARSKYDAWASRKGLTREEAMKSYVALVERLVGEDQ